MKKIFNAFKNRKQIAEAYSKDKPVEELFYQKRLAICEECPMNSKNNFSLTSEIIGKLTSEEAVCNACSCPIERKAGIKTAICGMVVQGAAPKWYPIVAEDEVGIQFFTVENLSFDLADLKVKERNGENTYVFDCGEIGQDIAIIPIKFIVQGWTKMQIIDMWQDCNCYNVDLVQKPDSIEGTILVPTKQFQPGYVVEKEFTINFLQEKGENKVKIKFKFIR